MVIVEIYRGRLLTMLRLFEIFVSSFQWHACKLADLSACMAQCMTTFFFRFTFTSPLSVQFFDTSNVLFIVCFDSWSYGVLLYEILTIGRFSYTTFTFKL